MATITRLTEERYRVVSGVGAGAGAALAMMLVMGALRLTLGVPTIPELMLGPILRLLGGRAFSQALDTLYYAGRPLLFTAVLEGTLLLGVLLGLLYARLGRPSPISGHRPLVFRSPLGGILYGLGIGVVLNLFFLPLLGEAPFASQASQLYSGTAVPLWIGLMLLALVYGITLHRLLPMPVPVLSSGVALAADYPVYISPIMEGSSDRRQFLRIVGGGLLALLGGGISLYGGTVLNQRGFTSPVDVPPPDASANAAPSDSDVAMAGDTPTAQPTPQATEVRPSPTEPPATQQPPTQAPPTSVPPTEEPTQAPPTPQPPTSVPPTQVPAQAPAGTTPPLVATSEPTPVEQPVPPTASAEVPQQPTSTPPPLPSTPTQLPPPPATPQPAQAAATAVGPMRVQIGVQEITPVASFYHVSKNFFDPSPFADKWSLSIKGMVAKPYSLTYKQLTAMPATTVTVGMMCISNPIGGGLIGNQTWKGVSLADLLKKAKPQASFSDVAFTADDGYTDSISLSKAMDPNVMLVWEMGGAALTPEHGGPARLLVPGIYGMKHVKWINTIELVAYDFKGYWQQPDQGWSDPAPVNLMSRIDTPQAGTLTQKSQILSGVAFAGDRSISKVEVSTDGGKTWNQAYLKPPLSGTSWAVWGYQWTPSKVGKYSLQVRATDGKGNLQTARRTDPYPNGATGYHTVAVKVN